MKKKILKKIVAASYNQKDILDETHVNAIANHLSRKELKDYIRALKQLEQKKRIIVDTSFVPTEAQKEIFKEQFLGKDVVFQVNQELLLGVKITNNDIVYDMNLKRTLDALEDFIDQQYD